MRFRPIRPVLALALSLLAACSGGDDDISGPADATPTPDAPAPDVDAAPPPDSPPPPLGTSCSVPIDLTAETEPLSQTTQFAGAGTGASCSGGAAGASELYFVYDAGGTPVDLLVDVVVNETGPAPFDVVLSARADCTDETSELGCADVGWGEHLEVLGATGAVTLLVDGSPEFGGTPVGSFTILVTRRTIVGVGDVCDPAGLASRCDTDLICQAGACAATSPTMACLDAVDLTADLADGSAQASATVLLTDPDYYQGSCAFDLSASYPERIFRIDTSVPGLLVALTDVAETTYDTVLYLKGDDCGAAETACNDDVDAAAMNYRSRLTPAELPPGTYYLFVDLSSGFLYGTPGTTPHSFQLDVSFTPSP